MPNAPLRPCNGKGKRCPNLVPKGERYCGTCKPQQRKADDARTGTATERGYDARWHKYRNWFLARNPLCEVCGRAAEMVDHIIPPKDKHDPLFYDDANHQALCWDDHRRKHRRDDGKWADPRGMRHPVTSKDGSN